MGEPPFSQTVTYWRGLLVERSAQEVFLLCQVPLGARACKITKVMFPTIAPKAPFP